MPRTILLADDSITIRKVIELTFSDSDIRVEAVRSGEEALRTFEDRRPDLVLADVGMPAPSGYEVCRAVKRSTHPVPVLLLAGTFEPFDARRAEECGADGHLVKPFESRTLVDKVETLLARPAAAPAEVEAVLDELAAGEAPDVSPAPPEEAAAEADDPAEAPVHTTAPPLVPEQLDALARAVVERLSDAVLREIAWEVVPDLAESIIRERLRNLEREAAE